MLTLVGLIVLVCVTPFAIYRYFDGSYLIAIVDGFLVVSTSSAVAYAWYTGQTKVAGFFVACLFCAGFVLVATGLGPVGLFWIFPLIVFIFFLVPPLRALLLLLLVLVSMLTITGFFPELIFADRFQMISFIVTSAVTSFFSYVFAYRTLLQRRLLEQMAAVDALTGAANRRQLDHALQFAARHLPAKQPNPAALLLLDLDHFKLINDTEGHQAGDLILIELVTLLEQHTRPADQVFRFGGEEFVVLLEGVTAEEARSVAEKLRQLIADNLSSTERKVTASVGVASLLVDEHWEQWLSRADMALYQAKSQGRNCVVMAAGSDTPAAANEVEVTVPYSS